MPNHATLVVVYAFILTRFGETGNSLAKKNAFAPHRLSFTHSRYVRGIFPWKVCGS